MLNRIKIVLHVYILYNNNNLIVVDYIIIYMNQFFGFH